MGTVKALIVEIHRRSLWQVLAVYVATSWFVLQAAEHVVNRYLLPEWVYGGAVVLLLVGFPIVLATALVREEPPGGSRARPADDGVPEDGDGRAPSGAPAAREEAAAPVSAPARPPLGASLRSSRVGSLLTWPRAIAGGVLAFAVLALMSGFVLVRGVPRVAEARGSAGDAFAERGWVVLAEFEAVDPEDAPVARAAREALTVDLQQSSFVNVYGRAQAAGILQRMGLPDTARLELPLALEVAERAGAGAVLGVTVSRLGPQYVLTAAAIHVPSREELFAVRAAAGSGRLLEGVETLSRELRRRLGEEREAIRRSRPLPAVTTTSLEALKVYAEAEDAVLSHEFDRAAALAAEAVRLDPGFAMAHRLAGVVANNRQLLAESRKHLTRAYELPDRFTDRERLHVEAFYHLQVTLEPRLAAGVYERLLARYPDDSRAANNMGVILSDWLSDPESAHSWFVRARELDPHSGLSLFNAIESYYRVGRVEVADSLERVAEEQGFHQRLRQWRLGRAFAEGDHRRVDALCDSPLVADPGTLRAARERQRCAAMDVARGRVRAGAAGLRDAERTYRDQRLFRSHAEATVAMAMAQAQRRDRAAAAALLERYLDDVPADSIAEPDRSIVQTDLRVTAALLERIDVLERLDSAYAYPDTAHILSRAGEALARAAWAVAADDGETALAVLRPAGRPPSGWRVLDELLRGLAFDLAGQADSAVYHLERAADPVYATYTRPLVHLPFVLRRLAEVEESRGNADGAARAYRRLLALWADADPELRGDISEIRSALARIGSE